MSAPTKSAIVRRQEADEGRAFARSWRARNHPVAATAPYPFRDHRTCAEWSEDEPSHADGGAR